MPRLIPPVANKVNVSQARFLDITLPDINNPLLKNTYYISTATIPVVIDGNTYTERGVLLSVSDVTTNLRSTSGDVQITLSGVPNEADYMTTVLNTPIKGGTVKIRRGFFDPTTQTVIPGEIYPLFTGYIENYAVSENTNFFAGEYTNSITVICSSFNSLLEQSVSGQRTNGDDRRRFYPDDISFDRVADLQNTDFDFGKPYRGGTGYTNGQVGANINWSGRGGVGPINIP